MFLVHSTWTGLHRKFTWDKQGNAQQEMGKYLVIGKLATVTSFILGKLLGAGDPGCFVSIFSGFCFNL